MIGMVASIVPVFAVCGRCSAKVGDSVFVCSILVIVGRALKVGDVAGNLVAITLLTIRAPTRLSGVEAVENTDAST